MLRIRQVAVRIRASHGGKYNITVKTTTRNFSNNGPYESTRKITMCTVIFSDV